MLKTLPKTHITIAAAATVVVTAAILMSPSSDVEAKRMSYSLDLNGNPVTNSAPKEGTPTSSNGTSDSDDSAVPAKAELAITSPIEDQAPKLNWQEHKIKSGDTLSSLFRDAGFNDGIMLKVIHGEGDADKLQRLYAGETIAFATDANGDLAAIDLKRSLLETLHISRVEDGFKGETIVREPEARPAFASGVIDGSLYVAAREAGMSDRLAMEMAGIFGWDIDFVYDVRKGDRFEVVYEELYLDGEKFDTGRILSARFINRGEDNVALLYTDSNGDSDYYAPDGSSMRKAFLRTPINARVSSPFNMQRRHPILDVVRPHEGTDYAAPPGTPIKAAGNGRVHFAGWKGGYGRTVILSHGDNITTLYAHMSRLGKGIRNGSRVKQGETIGYVGSSGMVTGPHLHYEFRKNGAPRNSRTVDLPDAKPVPKSEMARFSQFAEQRVAQFEVYRDGHQQLALAQDQDE
ncbi:OapA family protein [Marinobacter sp. GN3S48]|uniref:OapA family protein n=1 Tax=Marinobacter sp. GN3S48 TaxID=3382302 RepID=UPI00387B4FA5